MAKRIPGNLKPTVVRQVTFNTEEISRMADPDWIRDRNFGPAYKFDGSKRTFVDHRDRVYDHPEADE